MSEILATPVINLRVSGARGPIGLDLEGPLTPGQFLVKAPGGARTFTTASGTGADAGLRADLAAGDGAANVGVEGRSAGIVRSVQQILAEGLDVKKDFGAVGDRTTNDNSALSMAFDDCVPNGFRLQISRGTYRFTETLGGTVKAFDPNTLGAYGFSLVGHAGDQSVFYFDGDPADDAIALVGSSAGGDSTHIANFSIVRPEISLTSGATGAGLRIDNFTNAFIREIYTFGNGFGLCGENTKQLDVIGFWSRYDDVGIFFTTGGATGPNLVSMRRWSAIAPATCGARFINGACVALRDGGVEGCAADRASGAYNAVEIFQPGAAGAAAVTCDNLYFENNRGRDMLLTPTSIGCTWSISNSTFNRVEPYSNGGIVFDADSQIAGGPTHILDLSGVGFLSTITPSSGTPFVTLKAANGYDGLIFDDSKTLYPNTTELPVISAAKVRHISNKGVTTAAAFIAGAGGFVGTPRGVVSTARTGAGVYTITMPRAVINGATPLFIPSFAPQNIAGTTMSYAMSGSVITVTFSVGATPTDVSFAFSGTYV